MVKKKFGKITNVSITVFFDRGKMTGTPWFKTVGQARSYMKRKLNQMGVKPKQIEKIYKYEWREGMTLDDVKKVRLKSL